MGAAHVEFSAKDAGLSGFMDRMGQRVTKFGGVVAGIGGTMMGLGGAILGPLAGLFTEVVGHFDEVNDAADRLGTTTESISRLGYAASLAGSSMEEVEGAAKIMQRSLIDAPENFDRIGLSAEELRGMNLEDQFAAIADGLAGIEDPAERTAAAMSVFGKSGAKMLPLLKDGAGALRDAFAESDLTGATVNSDDAKNAAKAADAMDKAWIAVKNTFRAVGAAFLPLADSIEDGTQTFLQIAKGVREFINENRAAIQTVAAVAAGVAAAGAALVGIGGAIAAVGFAMSGLMTAVSAVGSVLAVVFSPVGLGIAAIVAAGVALTALVMESDDAMSVLGEIGSFFGEIWGGIVETFERTYGGIRDALKAGDLKLAFEVGVAGLDVIWKGLMVGLTAAWVGFKELIVDTFYDIVTEVKVAIIEAVKFINDQFGSLLDSKIGKVLTFFSPAGLLVNAARMEFTGMDPAQVRADAEKDKRERQKFRDVQLEAALMDLEAAKKNLQNKQAEAAEVRARQELAKLGTAFIFAGLGAFAGRAKRGADFAASLAGSAGSFSGRGFADSLGIGGTFRSLEDLTKDQNKILERIEKKVGGIGVD